MSEYISFQGERGANSHLACQQARPQLSPLPCTTFEDTLEAVSTGAACEAMVPIDNSVWGRVADTHNLLPQSGLRIVAEHFLRIHFHLMAPPGLKMDDVCEAHSHVMALGQCRTFLRDKRIASVVAGDTAGAARQIADAARSAGSPGRDAAIAPRLAADEYGLDIIAENIEDSRDSTTRFILLRSGSENLDIAPQDGPCVTALVFEVRNVSACLYKAMGGFATNGVNMTKLESYQLGGTFTATQFYAEIEGHPDTRPVQLALEELDFFSRRLDVLGVFPADPRRAARDREMDGR